MKIPNLEEIWDRAWNGKGKMILALTIATLAAMGCETRENKLWMVSGKKIRADYKQTMQDYEKNGKTKAEKLYLGI